MNNLYQEILHDHFRHPHNKGPLADADFLSDVHNPSCGDSVFFYGKINDGVIQKLSFEGSGCVISQATASILTEQLVGKTVEEIQKLDKHFILRLIGIQLGPTRLKCALLPLQAVQEGTLKIKK